MVAGALFLTPVAMGLEGVPSMPSGADLAAVRAVALFPGFLGHSLVIWSHAHVESWRSALITQATPLIATILAFVFLDEPIPAVVAIGGALVVSCTAAVIVHAARREPDVVEASVESPG